jgi:TPR repeat protein
MALAFVAFASWTLAHAGDVPLAELKAAAEQGDAVAQFRLANLYAYGSGVQQNFPEAMKWHLKAAEQGHAGAQCYLGIEHLEGAVANRDATKALGWFRKAADQNHGVAQFYVAIIHLQGIGVTKDTAEARKWLQKAADQGEPHALFHLGSMHCKGKDIPKDMVTGLMYLNLAALNANRVPEGEEAGDSLRKLEKNVAPEEFAKGREKAVQWARSGASRGQPEAQYVLGIMYAQGRAVPKDLVQAHLYLSLAIASERIPEATIDRMELEEQMTAGQIEDGRRKAREWKTSPPAKE